MAQGGPVKKQAAGMMGSLPGNVQQISANDVRKLRLEISNLRSTNHELKEELSEARRDYVLAK